MLSTISLVVACTLWLPLSRQQVVPVSTTLRGLCHVSVEDLRVLPSSGFTRSVLEPFNSTLSPASAPIPALTESAGCLFQSYDPEFDQLLGSNQTIYQVGPTRTNPWAAESPAYLPDTDEIIFASYFVKPPSTVSRLSLATGQVTQLDISPPIGSAAGASLYVDGQVAFSGVGDANDDANPSGFFLVDPYSGNSTILMNNFFGIRFNGLNDIQSLTDGSLIGNDGNYTSATPFKNAAVLPNDVWILPPTGPPRPLVADLPNCPNGIAVSPDEKTLYIGVAPLDNDNPFVVGAVDYIYAFDLVNVTGGYFAQNKRVFAKADSVYVDGFTVDGQGNIYAATGDGVSVYNPGGKFLGEIIVPFETYPIGRHYTNSLTFAGNRLIMMHNTGVLMLDLNTTSITSAAAS